MAMTLRLPEPMQAELQAYARAVGVPLSGVVAIAVRHYLDERRRRRDFAALQPPKLPKVWEDEAHEARADALKLGAGRKSEQRRVDQRAGELLTQRAIAAGELRDRDVVWKAPKSPRAPCPCGADAQWRHCHGKKREAEQG